MKIKSLEIENFKLFDNKFDKIKDISDKDLILLNGPNGYGKTTVFDALELALTGEIKRIITYNEDLDVKKNEKSDRVILIADPSKEAYVILTLEEGDCEFKLGRFYERPLDGRGTEPSVDNNPHKIFEKFKRKLFVNGEEIYQEEAQSAFLNKHHLDNLAEFFDQCCFLSQDEHLQFLKESKRDKSTALDFLFHVPERKDAELKRLNEIIYALKNSNKKNNLGYLTILEKNRGELENVIKELEDNLKNNLLDGEMEEGAEYQCLFPGREIKWDEKTPLLRDEEYKEAFKEVDDLIYYAQHQEDCVNYIWNNPFQDLLQPFYGGEDIRWDDRPLEYACRYFSLIQKGEELEEKYQKEQRLEQLKQKLEKRDIHKINWEIVSDEKLLNEEKIKNIKEEVAQLEQLEQLQGTAEKVITSITGARTVLFRETRQAMEQKVIDEGECPYCGKLYGEKKILEEKFAAEERKLLNQSQGISKDIQDRINRMFENDLNNLLEKINVQLRNRVSGTIYIKCQEVKKHKARLNKISDLLQKMKISLPEEFQEDMVENQRNYENLFQMIQQGLRQIPEEVKMQLEEKGFLKDYDRYYDSKESGFIQNTTSVLQEKKTYIKKLFFDSNRQEIMKKKDELNKIKKRYEKLNEYYEDLCKYRTAIEEGIEAYKRKVIHDIEPLLHVYTAKILQQKFSGKSIFILTDKHMNNLQFIHSTEDNQDILYNMSSGQLAAVSLSFLLCMHQVYAQQQGLPILLIDDPIQTIDDVNMVGLVDILRFEFKDTQVFISTHEQKFEWYLKYKYTKAMKKIESFNMKDLILQGIS